MVGNMTEELKAKICEYLATHYYLNLATLSPQGRPMAHTMAYVSENEIVYLATNKNTRKVQNIMQNPYVAFTVDEDDPDWFDMQALQVEGRASIVTDETELREVGEIMAAKFPVTADMPPDPDTVMIKIEPELVYYLDYSIEFGHREMVTF
jgi:general stress protein 26